MGCCQTNKSCNCNTDCCETDVNENAERRIIKIDFMYLDLNVCTRCMGTENSLEDAINDVKKVLELTDIEVEINKIHIDSREKAIQNRFESSPTIRVNGKDIQLEVKENLCDSCGDLCGDEVDCRIWVYKGKEYSVPPKAMIIDAILREVYTNSSMSLDNEKRKDESFHLPENLNRFFEAMKKTQK